MPMKFRDRRSVNIISLLLSMWVLLQLRPCHQKQTIVHDIKLMLIDTLCKQKNISDKQAGKEKSIKKSLKNINK